MRTDVEGNTKRIVQSEDSVHIKYQRSLCQYCNSTRSQPWDQAYDKFMDFIHVHGERIIQARIINLNEIAPGSGKQFANRLYSYFVKAFGCQIVEHGQPAPSDLSKYLLGKRTSTHLVLTFAIYSDFPSLSSPMLQVHSLEADVEHSTGKPVNFIWAASFEWLTTIYWYRREPSAPLGCPWNGTTHQIKIGNYGGIFNR